MKIRLALLLTLCLVACAGSSATATLAPTFTPVNDGTSSVATPTASPKQLLFIEFFAIH